MGHNTIQVTAVTPNIGGLVEGIDLTRPLDAPTVEDLHDALMEHQVLFFRDQELTHETQKALGEHFGKLHISVGGDGTNSKQLQEYPEVRSLHFDENSKSVSGNETWHTDQSCMETPPMGTVLYIHTVPPAGGGDTMFASMYAAYEALSPAMKRYLEGMTAVHDGAGAFSHTATNQLPVAEQPMVAKHPVTGASCSTSIPASRRIYAAYRRPRATRSSAFSTATASIPTFTCGFAGSPIRWRSGTTAAPIISRSGTTTPIPGRATASRSRARTG